MLKAKQTEAEQALFLKTFFWSTSPRTVSPASQILVIVAVHARMSYTSSRVRSRQPTCEASLFPVRCRFQDETVSARSLRCQ